MQEGIAGPGMFVALVDRGFFDSFKEANALAHHLKAAHEHNDSVLVRDLAAGHDRPFGMTSSPEEVVAEHGVNARAGRRCAGGEIARGSPRLPATRARGRRVGGRGGQGSLGAGDPGARSHPRSSRLERLDEHVPATPGSASRAPALATAPQQPTRGEPQQWEDEESAEASDRSPPATRRTPPACRCSRRPRGRRCPQGRPVVSPQCLGPAIAMPLAEPPVRLPATLQEARSEPSGAAPRHGRGAPSSSRCASSSVEIRPSR